MNYLLAIDPGTTSGIVVMTIEKNPKLVYCSEWNAKRDSLMPSTVVKYLKTYWSVSYAAIEDQYLGLNANTLKKLARNGGRWQEACEGEGIPVMFIPPSTWQTAMLGLGPRSKGAQRGKMTMMIARQDTGIKLTADECSAWVIGKYAIGEMK